MAAAATATEDGAAGSNKELGLYTKFCAWMEVFLASNTSVYIHNILLITDVALLAIFGLSYGTVVLLEPVLYLLVIAHFLFYGLPILIALRHVNLTRMDTLLPQKNYSAYVARDRHYFRERMSKFSRRWIKWGVLILVFPVILGDFQSRLSETAPEAAELIETIHSAMPVVQDYAVTVFTFLALFTAFRYTLLISFRIGTSKEYSDRLDRLQ